MTGEGSSAPARRRRARAAESGPPVVALAGSFIGLEALGSFFEALGTASTGLVFVVLPDRASAASSGDVPEQTDPEGLLEHLARLTPLQVRPIQDRQRIQADHVYVLPPAKYASIRHGLLRLSTPSAPRELQRPIDFFLRTLARDAGERAAAVILSGSGSDGAIGVKAIKAAGGLVLAQTPETAKQDALPIGAIATGVIDGVFAPEDMPGAIARCRRSIGETSGARHAGKDSEALAAILEVLRKNTGHEFRHYKRGTLRRRIQRRVDLVQAGSWEEYAEYLEKSAGEPAQLVKDLLIGVTSFFREPEAWKVLEQRAFPRILREVESRRREPVRVWVAGCSTGEEAYSVAMLLVEALERLDSDRGIQVFATDLDRGALEIARAGVYPETIAAEVEPERLAKFFHKELATYRVKKELRDLIVFAHHDLVRDPPYSKVDLVTCRNLLIYLQVEVQRKIIPLFHFALRQHGHLMLGNSETIGHYRTLFEAVSRRWRIYQRIGTASRTPRLLAGGAEDHRRTPRHAAGPAAPQTWQQLTQAMLLRQYAPASVLVDRAFHVLYFHGNTAEYLVQPTGEPTSDLLSLAPEALRGLLKNGLQKAVADQQPVVLPGLELELRSGKRQVRITITPAITSSSEPAPILVSFEQESDWPGVTAPGDGADAIVRGLGEALRSTREELRSTIEDLQDSNEELLASNEEVTSMNEELQSANEELETSKEELQSLNEELTALNQQLEEKIELVQRSNDDLDNLLSSTSIATLFLDPALRIKRYTAAATKLFSLIPGDLGREISDIVSRLADPELLRDARRVLDDLTPIRRELPASEGEWYLRRVLPYRTRDQRIEGVVVIYDEITELKQAEAALRGSEERYRTLTLATTSVVFLRGARGVFELPQPSWERHTGQTWEQHRGWGWLDAVHPDDRERVKRAWETAVQTSGLYDVEIRVWNASRSEFRWAHARAAPVRDEQGTIREWIGTHTDVHERRQAEEALQAANRRVASVLDSISDAFLSLDREWKYLYLNPSAEELLGQTRDELLGRKLQAAGPISSMFHVPESIQAMAERTAQRFEVFLPRRDAWFEVRCFPSAEGLALFISDVTERKRREMSRDESDQRLEEAVSASRGGFWEIVLDPEHPSELPERAHLSAALKRIIGFEDHEFPGSRAAWEARIFPEDRPVLEEARRACLSSASGGSYECEYRIQHRNNGLRWLWTRGRLLRDRAGRPVRWVGIDWDVTGRKQDEHALRESEERFRRIADATPVMIWQAGAGLGKNYFNRGWLDFTGRSLEQEQGEGWLEPIHAEDRDAARAGYLAAGEQRSSFELTYRLRRRDGQYRWVLDRGVPRHDPGGVFLGYIGGSVDISDRIELEAKLRTQAAQLAAADRRKDDFLAMLAHELRNPLAPIHNAVQLLRTTEGALRPDLDWVKDTIGRQVQQMSRLVDDLLDVARITRGRIELRRSPLRLSEIVYRAIETVQPLIDARELTLEVVMPERPVTIEADRERLAQVIGNLLHNSAKFTDRGGRIRLAAKEEGPELVLEVSDTGAGIPKDLLPVIFDLFTQADRSLDRSQGGLGLGLTLARSLTEMHGGTIEVTSDGPGKGSTFTLRLPLPKLDDRPRRFGDSFLPEPYVKPRKILVVDDAVDSADTLAILLRARGHQVRAVNDAFEALDVVEPFAPDVGLIDIGLPHMDGYELARRLRETEVGRRMILVAQTGYGQEDDRRRAAEAGFDHHLLKPIDFRALAELLSRD